MWTILLVGILLIALLWLTRLREGFIDLPKDVPDPNQLVKQIRNMMAQVEIPGANIMGHDAAPLFQKVNGLLSKYDNPENIGHVMEVKDKDPGQLARMYLNINND